MTIEQHVRKYLFDNFISGKEQEAILSQMKARMEKDLIKIHWSDLVKDYPPNLLVGLRLTADAEAKKWLRINRPHHLGLHVLEAS